MFIVVITDRHIPTGYIYLYEYTLNVFILTVLVSFLWL